MHTKTTRKEQSAIRLWHMDSGLNGCRRQPIPRFAQAEGKFIAETRQHMEEQFAALEDQLETTPTQISNLCRHKGSGYRNLFTKRRTHGRQHFAQAHANRWVSRFELNIPEFNGDLEPEEFLDWVLATEEVLEFNRMPDE